MDSTVPEWVHYGSSTADIISDYFAKGLVIFTIFGLPLYVRLRQARSTEPWGFKPLFQHKK